MPAPAAAPPPASKTSGLAIASLVCSCAGLLFAFLGTVPGVILGFKALRQIKAHPGLSGKGLAKAGLVTGGVLTLVWIPLAFILTVAAISGFRAAKALETRMPPVQDLPQAPKPDLATQLAPEASGWRPELQGIPIPETPVAGRLGGFAFTPGDIALRCEPASTLEFSHALSTPGREELFELSIDLGQQDAAKYSGRTLTVTREGVVTVQPPGGWNARPPAFRLLWTDPGTKPFPARLHNIEQSCPCAMRLEFGELKGGKIPGRIYLCVFDSNKSFLRGKFLATVFQTTPIGSAGGELPALPQAQPLPGTLPTDTSPDAAGWTLDLSNATIPNLATAGRVHGTAFKMDRATFEGPMLKLRQGVGFFADREFEILIWDAAGDPAKLGKRTIEVLPGDVGPKPNVRLSWMEPGRGVPESLHVDVYAMRLEFGEVRNGRITGRIYLCVADREKSFVRGQFTASLPSWATPTAAPQPIPPTRPPNFPIRPSSRGTR